MTASIRAAETRHSIVETAGRRCDADENQNAPPLFFKRFVVEFWDFGDQWRGAAEAAETR